MKLTFCWKLLLGLMIFSLQTTFVMAYPSVNPSALCRSNQYTLGGAIEMYNMDSKSPIDSQYGKINSIKIDGKILKKLLEANYLRDVSSIEKSIKDFNCEYYYIPIEDKDTSIIICKKHGIASIGKEDFKELSPKEQFAKVCTKFGLDPQKYKLDLKNEAFSGIKGPKVIKLLTNFWMVFLIFPVAYFFYIKNNFAEISTMAKAYIFGNSIVAMIFILSILHNFYRNPYFFAFLRDESTWSFPSGVLQIATMIEVSCIGWWIASLFGLYLFKRNNLSLLIPILNLLIIPVLVIGSGPLVSLLKLLPFWGLFMFYTMTKLKAEKK